MSPTRLALALSALVCFPLSGCVEESDTHEIKRQEIMGGYEDVASTFAVGLYAAQGYAGGICSGTLIAPNLVLTAQHCIAEVTSQYVICGETGFGEQIRPGNILVTADSRMRYGDFFNVNSVHVPQGSNDMCGNDIALLVLSENIPDSVAVPIIPKIDILPREGEVYSAIGYGHDGTGRRSGVRRRIDNRVVQCAGAQCPGYTSVQITEFLGSDGTCQGDSGGTALDEQGRVFGALSRGPSGCAGSVYSGVVEWADWIRDLGAQAAEYGGYTPHFWVTQGVSEAPADDQDFDDVSDSTDNCQGLYNPDQLDTDDDGIGNACDSDLDGDSAKNGDDNCPNIANEDQADRDRDGLGDECDDDADNDTIPNDEDNCPLKPNLAQTDSDQDGIGDACAPEPTEQVSLDVVASAAPKSSGGCSAAGTGPEQGLLLLLIGLFIRRRK